MNEEFAGQALKFVRKLLVLPARWGSAAEAASHLLLMRDAPPKFGSVVFYGSTPMGNCGVYVGQRQALTVDREGEPVLLRIDEPRLWGGVYLGWCPPEDLVSAEDRT